MPPTTLLRRTPTGTAEAAAPAHGLSITQRRLVTLLDMPLTLDELVRRSRSDPGRLERDLDRLERAGLLSREEVAAPTRSQPANDASAVRLGAPRLTHRIPLAMLAIAGSALVWWAWQHVAPPIASIRKAVQASGAPRSATPANAAAGEPEPIAIRVLRGDAERVRDAPRDARTATAKPIDKEVDRASAHPAPGNARAAQTAEAAASEPARAPNAGAAMQAQAPTREPTSPSVVAERADATRSVAAPPAVPSTATPETPRTATPPPASATASDPSFGPPPAPSAPASPAAAAPSLAAAAPSLAAATPPPAAVPSSSHDPSSGTDSAASSAKPVQLASASPTGGPARAAPATLVPIARDAPEFPREAIAQGIASGDVKARLTVDAQGRVSAVEILRTSHRTFERAVREALARWQFEPGASARTTIVDIGFKRD